MKEKTTEVEGMAKDFFDLGAMEGFEMAIKMLKNVDMDNYHNSMARKFAEYLEANKPE